MVGVDNKMKRIEITKSILVVVLLLCGYPVHAQENVEKNVANVGEVAIPVNDYLQNLRQAARTKFYHGKPPVGEFEALRKKVLDQMIDRILLVNEAKSHGRSFNQNRVDSRFERLLKQHGESAQLTEEVKESLRMTLREEDIIDQMRHFVEENTVVTDQVIEQFYNNNHNIFTIPEQLKISMILLKVDPSSPQAAWEAAVNESSKLVKMLREGADFSELARIHSADASSQQGGDMGYMHQGMLATEIQTVLDTMTIGEFSEPVLVLEGIAVFQLNDRKQARLLPLTEVKERARKLAHQKEVTNNWKKLIDRLRRESTVEVNEALLAEIRLG